MTGNPFPYARGVLKIRKKSNGNYTDTATKVQKYHVPPGKVWWILRTTMYAGDAAVIYVRHYDKESKLLGTIVYKASGTGMATGPTSPIAFTYVGTNPVLAEEGDYIEFNFSAAQTTGGDFIYLQYVEFDAEEVAVR